MTFKRTPGVCYKSISQDGVTRYEEIPRDQNGFSEGHLGSDEYALLSECGIYTDTGIWRGLFSYPNCSGILFERGWVSENGNPTAIGYIALHVGREKSIG